MVAGCIRAFPGWWTRGGPAWAARAGRCVEVWARRRDRVRAQAAHRRAAAARRAVERGGRGGHPDLTADGRAGPSTRTAPPPTPCVVRADFLTRLNGG